MLGALHVLTHAGLGWLVAHLARVPRRDRWLIVLAGLVLDLDGVGIVWSEPAYLAMHRAAGHSLAFAVVIVALTMTFAAVPWVTGALAAVSFHLHLLLDVVGTGGMPIRYFWPVSDWQLSFRDHWTLASWPNAVVTAVTLGAVLAIAWRERSAAGSRARARSTSASGADGSG